GPQTVERVDGEERVSQPAEAVIPVAAAARRLRQRRRQGGENGPGILEAAQLERDRGSDDRFLPVERYREITHPIVPVDERLFEIFAGDLVRPSRQVLIAAKEEMNRLFDEEGHLFAHIGDRTVGGEANAF